MFNIEFEYKDKYSNGKWNKQSCTVSSVEECKRIYGLGTTLEIPRWINPEHYAVTRPEVFVPTGDAFTPLAYELSHHSAAVAYSGAYRSFLMGFPFESIRSARDRDSVMASILDFLTRK